MKDDLPGDGSGETGHDLQKISGQVKWFDAVKGYGFVSAETSDESSVGEDVMVHVSSLRAAGLSTMLEGARLTCMALRRAKGLQAVEILEYSAPEPQTEVACEEDFEPILIKWFNRAKGYGFVNRVSDTDTDIFVHMVAVRKAGFDDLTDGANYLAVIREGPKGEHVESLKATPPEST